VLVAIADGLPINTSQPVVAMQAGHSCTLTNLVEKAMFALTLLY